MEHEEVQHVVEERHAPIGRDTCGPRAERPVHPGEHTERRAERHREIEEGGWILLAIEKRQQRAGRSSLGGPGMWVAVEVGRAQADEARDDRRTDSAEPLSSLFAGEK